MCDNDMSDVIVEGALIMFLSSSVKRWYILDASWKEHEVTCIDESDPLISGIFYPRAHSQVQKQPGEKRLQELAVVDGLTMNIEKATSLEDVPNLFVFVHMPVERNVEHGTPVLAEGNAL